VHQIGYLLALVFGTIWHGTRAIVAGWLGRRRTPGSLLDTVGRDWARFILRGAGVTVTIEGLEHLAPEGPQIIAANHQSIFDILAILGWVPLSLKFIAKKEVFRYPFFGPAVKAAGHIKLDRRDRQKAFAAYEIAALELVESRTHVLVFPEGTRSRTGLMLPFKKGPAMLAIASGAPLVPCYCAGTFRILPKGSFWVRPRPVRVMLGPPLSVEGLTYDDRDAFTERLREAVLALRERSVDAEKSEGVQFDAPSSPGLASRP
jgi:1-acyl-sn-glycerol-3-phosphate acyltransferase